jgi:polyisoprenoid-binding protein YceI
MTRTRWIVLTGLVAVVAVAGAAAWYFVLRDDSPPAVTLEAATKALERESDTSATSRADATASLDGTWAVDPSIGTFADFTSSFAGFRVEEELAGIGTKTAVGRTPRVTGQMTLQGTTITAARFEVDMTSLTTDDPRRDGQLRTQAIETNRFPTATFVLTQPIRLARIPPEGERITVNAIGDLTLHGVTKPVTFPLEAQRTGNVIAVVGSMTVSFADYSISKPTAALVLSVDDKGIIEVQLFLTRR